MIRRHRLHCARRLVVRFTAMALLVAPAFAAGPSAAAGLDWLAPPPHHHHNRTATTRVLPWPGGDRLEVAVAADVRYVQGADARVVITGPADQIDDIIVDGGVIRHAQSSWRWWDWSWKPSQAVAIVVTAPHISAVGVSGSGRLTLGRLVQDHLDLHVSGSGSASASGAIKALDLAVSGSGGVRLTQITADAVTTRISGSGWVIASGSATTLHLALSGSGRADLTSLALQDADAGLSGSGSTVLAPRRSAELSVSGSGSIRLLTRPPQLITHRSGSGSIIQSTGS